MTTQSRDTHASRPPTKTTLPSDGYEGRALRARADPMLVRPLRDDRYVVETDRSTYVVDLEERSCTCPDHAIRGARCKHLRRVAIEVNDGLVPPPGKRTAVCARCGRETFVPTARTGSVLCERHDLDRGDLVRDRETGQLLVVAAVTTDRADEHETEEGLTIDQYPTNADYGAHEPVIEAVYLDSIPPCERDIDAAGLRRYGFPASRLRPIDRDYYVPDRAQSKLDAFASAAA